MVSRAKSIDLLHDFFSDRSRTKLLEVECNFSDDYLIGHAKRVGLAGEETQEETLQQLLPTVRYDVINEIDAIKDAQFPDHFRITEGISAEQNALALEAFLSVDHDVALGVAQTPYLFVD